MARKSQSLLGKKPKIKVRASKRSLGASEPTFTDGQSLGMVAATEMYNFYNATYEQSDFQKWTVTWASKNGYTKDDVSRLRAASKALVQPTLGAICRLADRGMILNDDQKAYVGTRIERLIATVEPQNEKKEVVRKSPAELLREKISNFLAELEAKVDNWKDHSSYSLYDQLTAMQAAGSYAKAIKNAYEPLMAEVEELVSGASKDLNEAYAYMTKRERNGFMAFVSGLVNDADMYLSGKKAQRKPRVAKKPSVEKTVSKVKFQKENAEYKVKSIDPSKIIGAKVLYLFNTKYREVQVYKASDANGLSLKGTTLVGFDGETSLKKRVRENAIGEFLSTLLTTTQARATKLFEEAKAKPQQGTGRINEHCIILRVI